MTLLTILQDVVDEIGATARPSIVVGSADQTVRQLLALSNREGRQLVKDANWTVLQRLHSFTTVVSQAEYDLPSDYARVVVDTEWDEDQKWPLHGPMSPQGWRVLKVSVLGGGQVGKRYRVYRSTTSTARKFFVDPTPSTSGETLSFFYISKDWCASAAGATQEAWAADDDELLFDEELFKLGVIVRYKRAKGFDFASESDEYMQMHSQAKAQDRPARTIHMAQVRRSYLLGRENIPETNIGS